MTVPEYPFARALQIASEVAGTARVRVPGLALDEQVHEYPRLYGECSDQGIVVVDDETLPGGKSQAVSLKVDGTPFIVLDRKIPNAGQKAVAVAHELAHILLGHLERPNFALHFSEPMRMDDSVLQVILGADAEIEAETMGMALVMPDRFLHQQVEDGIFIPARKLAAAYSLAVEWVAARIQLYREMHGYLRSRQLLQERDRGLQLEPSMSQWFIPEMRAFHPLEHHIDSRLRASGLVGGEFGRPNV